MTRRGEPYDHEAESAKLFERLREWMGAEVERTGITAASRAAGVGQETLRRFLVSGRSMPATAEKIFTYVITSAVATEPDGPLHVSLLGNLLAAIGPEMRPVAMVETVRGLRGLYREKGRGSPPWLAVLAGVVDQLSEPPQMADEEIGSALDGTLSAEARERALVAAADSDPDARVLADTASVLRETEGDDADP